jgi:hypothetical protein
VHNEEDPLWWVLVGEKPSRGFLRCGGACGKSRATPTQDKKYECYEKGTHVDNLSIRARSWRDSYDGALKRDVTKRGGALRKVAQDRHSDLILIRLVRPALHLLFELVNLRGPR